MEKPTNNSMLYPAYPACESGKTICTQNYENYSDEDFKTWQYMLTRQNSIIFEKACAEFQHGIKVLGIEKEIVDIKKLSKKLHAITGWNVAGVDGLLSNESFFDMLSNKVFPVSVHIRAFDELEFSKLPDLFHDVYGHVSLLTNKDFCNFIHQYSQVALKYLNYNQALSYLGRLYWFTMETGVINEKGQIKPYGGAIMSSSDEIDNVYNPNILKHRFDIQKVMSTSYDNFTLQKEYFVIDSFEQMFSCVSTLEHELNYLLEHRTLV